MEGADSSAPAGPAPGTSSSSRAGPPFGDFLAERVAQRGSQLVLGLDPDPARLWPRAIELADTARGGSAADSAADRAARAVAAHCRLLLDAAGEQCVAVKPQVACFERLGAAGWAALAEVVSEARDRGLIVIADAKRGDIDISARAYAQAFLGATPTPFGEVAGLGADMLTVNPLLGRDSLTPLVTQARAAGAGLLALVRTSNPGAADLQDRELADGGTVSDALAALVDELGRPGVGAAGLSDVGAVAGATAPAHLERLRAAMPHAVMLLPGIGAQGASGHGLQAAFAPGAAGGLVSASRSIVYAFERDSAPAAARSQPGAGGGDPAAAARAEAARLRELIWSLYA